MLISDISLDQTAFELATKESESSTESLDTRCEKLMQNFHKKGTTESYACLDEMLMICNCAEAPKSTSTKAKKIFIYLESNIKERPLVLITVK